MTINLVSPSLCETIADLKTFDGAALFNGHLFIVNDLNKTTALFRWTTGIAGTGDDQLLVTPTTGGASGRFVRSGGCCDLKYAVDFSLANNATIFTVPTGIRLHSLLPWLEVTTAFSGGASSAIGVDSSNASYNTAGDLIGGDVGGGVNGLIAADLTVGFRGRLGPKLVSENTGSLSGAGQGPVVLVAGDTVRWNRITSVFTDGAGFLHFPVIITQV